MTEKLIFKFHLILINSRMWLVATVVWIMQLQKDEIGLHDAGSPCLFFVYLFVIGLEAIWLVLVLLEYFSCYRTQLDLSPKFRKVVFSMERVHFGVWKNCGFLFNYHIAHLCSDCIKLNVSMNQVFLQVQLFFLARTMRKHKMLRIENQCQWFSAQLLAVLR